MEAGGGGPTACLCTWDSYDAGSKPRRVPSFYVLALRRSDCADSCRVGTTAAWPPPLPSLEELARLTDAELARRLRGIGSPADRLDSLGCRLRLELRP